MNTESRIPKNFCRMAGCYADASDFSRFVIRHSVFPNRDIALFRDQHGVEFSGAMQFLDDVDDVAGGDFQFVEGFNELLQLLR
jgi:hypothetical protein